ncbi:Atg12p [Ascoidea rubescens DSM 1968]|uniref:Ubiquitin-like protein ATG12 n=1 Tax=Ascoidea rubescens DSM 1968 TaxID=1344418 RepID=A0A1D2VNB6_9ASCO|nr:APG12-domain-containing protein [Ascoidea rubescens DSM 1968]ODV63067.1 APG12-domain-containing protein [Ascoidea rubescens DSM 1968]
MFSLTRQLTQNNEPDKDKDKDKKEDTRKIDNEDDKQNKNNNNSNEITIQDTNLARSKISTTNSLILHNLPSKQNNLVVNLSKNYDKTNQVQKCLIRFQSIGSVNQIQPKVYKISSNQQFSSLIVFLKKKLKIYNNNQDNNNDSSTDSQIFCYIKNTFAPSPDEIIGNLFKNFATNNELIVCYCNTVAFG